MDIIISDKDITAGTDIIISDKDGKIITTVVNDKKNIDLSGLDLSNANLRSLDLSNANLKGSKVTSSDFKNSDISLANLTKSKASGSDFKKANCSNVIFFDAELEVCDFRGTDLSNSNFGRANLSYSDMTGAVLDGVGFLYANMTGVIGLVNIALDGDLSGWKKLDGGLVAELIIPAEARRVNPLGTRFCRAEFAMVVGIEAIKKGGKGGIKEGFSIRDSTFRYGTDELVTPDGFNDDVRDNSSHGIHFYLTRDEAVNS